MSVLIVIALGMGVLWWRLGTGPINLNAATPWLAAAVKDNFGDQYRVSIGGTQIERGDRGLAAIRILDIVVRDRDNNIVANAPKAEIGVSLLSLLQGRLRAKSLNLVETELNVRIGRDGKVTVAAGSAAKPLDARRDNAPSTATATPAPGSPIAAPVAPSGTLPAPAPSPAQLQERMAGFSALLAWIDGLGAVGLDGHDLDALGFKNGNLIVDDEQSGKHWSFEHISLSLTRPRGGGVVLAVGQDSETRPWLLRAAVGAPANGVRAVEIVANQVSTKDIMLAMRMNDAAYAIDLPISGHVRGEIGRDGFPTFLNGKIVTGAGTIVEKKVPDYPLTIDQSEISIEWDSNRRIMVAPFQIVSGASRITLLAHLEPPNNQVPYWQMGLSGGTILLAGGEGSQPLILDRIAVRVQFRTDVKRIVMERADFSNGETSVAGSGALDYSGDEPRLSLGFAGTPMSVASLKRIWPATVVPEVREWVHNHVQGGTVQRVEIGVNAPTHTLVRGGPPIPDEGLSVDITATGSAIKPVDTLPVITGADLRIVISGRKASVKFPQGQIETPEKRKLMVRDVVFEVPDVVPKPIQAKVNFRVDGPVPAAAEILAMDRLSDFSGTPVDPNASKGTMEAQVSLQVPLKRNLQRGETQYTMNVDLTNFSAERMVMNQKLEASSLKIVANNQGYVIKGDARVNGTLANIDFRRPRGSDEADLKIFATLDEAARARLGLDAGDAVRGALPVKISGKVAATGMRDTRLAIEADLAPVAIDNAVPGWVKVAGKPAKASLNLVVKNGRTRFEDIVVEGGGTQIKGYVELDENNNFVAASLPTFSPSDGDRASLKAERGSDGALKVTMRGDLFDGRAFIKEAMAGRNDAKSNKKKPALDVDLDIKLTAVMGHHGEALRSLDFKGSRRSGRFRTLALSAKIGRDTALSGDIRGQSGARQVIYLETMDAGSFFRFTDTYAKMYGGNMWVAMDAETSETKPQDGLLNIRDFVIRGENALDRVVAQGQGAAQNGVPFSQMRVEFARLNGVLNVRDGVVRGPIVGATIDGDVDFGRNSISMRGTFVPLYGLNNMFGQIPIVGIFLGGGSNEGLLGVTYEVVGAPGAPVLRVNPISAVAPGLLRKFFEFPNGKRGAPLQTENETGKP